MEWAEKVKECRSSGEKVSEWCREHGISSKTYHRWEREVLETAGKMQGAGKYENGIMALTIAEEYTGNRAAARICAGGVTVEIERGADAETIRAIIEAVRGC